jgi:glycosyltransferase involved in cell wall biosynthesis
MRVLHLDSGLDWRGGQQQVYGLAEGLSRRGVEQCLMVQQEGALFQRLLSLPLALYPLACKSEFNLKALWALGKRIKQFQPEIVHAHDSRTLGLAVQLKLLRPSWKLIAARRVAFRLHSNPLWKFKYLRATDKIVAVSDYIRRQLIAEGIDPARIALVYDGLDLNAAAPAPNRNQLRTEWGIAPDDFVIGCVGQMTAEKGHEYLIRGFRKINEAFPKTRLMLVGDGPLRRHLEQLGKSLLPEKSFIFTGFIECLTTIFSSMDLFVFPSLAEGLGSTLLLAMAFQVPICASHTGGIPELVDPGKRGFLFPPGDSDALAAAVSQVLQNPLQAGKKAASALEWVKSRFLVDHMVEETLKVYLGLLKPGHASSLAI